VPRNRCPGSATGTVTSDFVDRPWKLRGGRIDIPGGPGSFFRGRIAGSTASGVLADRAATATNTVGSATALSVATAIVVG
jgi:hypothetical protein